jgi:predicted nucleic acid-binding protein
MTGIADSGPLIWLSQIGRFDLLRQLFDTVIIAPAVYAETVTQAAGYPNAEYVQAAVAAEWMRVQAPCNDQLVLRLLETLHLGEAETLAIALENPMEEVLVDDLQARRTASKLGLRIVGTAGLLVIAQEQGLISEVKPHLDQLRSLGFRLSERVYQQILTSQTERLPDLNEPEA